MRLAGAAMVVAVAIAVSTHSRAMRLVDETQPNHWLHMFQLTAARCGWSADPLCHDQCRRFNSQPRDAAGPNEPTYPSASNVSTHSRAMRLAQTTHAVSRLRTWFQLTAARCGWFCPAIAHAITGGFNSQPRDAAGCT